MDVGKIKVEKLRDMDNWQEWQFAIRTLMKNDDILRVCDGTFVKPEERTQDYEAQLITWTNANRAAKKLIVMTLESKLLQLIMNCDTARDMW